MAQKQEVHNLEELLEVLAPAGDGKDEASVEDIHEAIGIRSFGPLLLAGGLIALTPVGGIPAVPTAIAAIVILISSQLLIGLRRFWIPGFSRRRSVSRQRLHKAIGLVRPVARGIDLLIRPRLTWLTEKPFTYAIAAMCILIALLMPPLELVPFAGGVPALAISLFGLGLIARDGAVVALAFGWSGTSFYIAARSLW